MTLQNTTVEDSEEYKARKRQHLHAASEYRRVRDELAKCILLLRQFHYGPVDETYKKQVADYIEKEGL